VSAKALVEATKKTGQITASSAGLLRQQWHGKPAPPLEASEYGFGHDFSRVRVDSSTGPDLQSCPLAVATPRLCPFGGICHTCPVPIQAKRAAGHTAPQLDQAGDVLEQEASRTAEHVMGPFVPECGAPPHPRTVGAGAQTAEPGQPLTESVRAFFQPRFGFDFAQVRIHTSALAAASARSIDALAYTVGSDIVFAESQYAPGTWEGRRLLAHELAHVVQQSAAAPRLQRYPRGGGPPGARGRRPRPLVEITIETPRTRIDNSRSIDQITHEMYRIPIELLPPGSSIPMGPLLTIGPYGCGLRRYGLTLDEFSLDYTLEDRDIEQAARPFEIVPGGHMQTVECWASHVRFRARLQQTIFIPNDLARHPCMEGSDPAESRREILEHERLHEADNNRAAQEMRTALLTRLGFTPGIGRLMAMVRITEDPEAFVEESSRRLRRRLDELRDEFDLRYHRLSSEYASILDPHDRELHELKQRLLEEARARSSRASSAGGGP